MNSADHNPANAKMMGRIEQYCELLRRIYDSFPAGSLEQEAVLVATKALLFSMPKAEFHAFLSGDELTPEQTEHLVRLGIESIR